MKRLLLAVAFFVLAACGTERPATLLDWVSSAGLYQVVDGTSGAIAAAANELKDLGAGTDDVRTMVGALQRAGTALAEQADALASEATSDNADYESIRARVVAALHEYATAAAELDADAIVTNGDLARVTAAVQRLTEVSAALTDLNTFIDAHGSDPTTSA